MSRELQEAMADELIDRGYGDESGGSKTGSDGDMVVIPANEHSDSDEEHLWQWLG